MTVDSTTDRSGASALGRRKFVVGLVGGMGAGKSQVAAAFARRGASVVDADAFGHEALRQPAIRDQVAAHWGEGVLDAAGEVDRRKLGARVFADAAERLALESLVFPWIERRIQEEIDRARKYVVSTTLSAADWNAELLRGDVEQTVRQLKQEPGGRLWVGGVTLPSALADLGLIDEYEFVVQPVVAGHGPTLLAGLRERIRLELVDRQEFPSGAVAMRYRPI